VSTLALYDVCYLLKVGGVDSEGVPVGLLPLDPGMVMPTTATSISSFLPAPSYNLGGTEVPADRLVILHRSPLPGVSDATGGVINLARVTFAAAIAAEGYASRYWQAGGSPTTVLEADAQIPDPIANQIADRWRERRSKGPDYAPVLSGGVKARMFGADPTAQAAVEARREQVADVGRYFGVPTRILNAPTGDSETYTSTESGNQDLVRYTLQNYIGAIEDGISDQLPRGRTMAMETRRLTAGTQLAQAQALQILTGGKAVMDVPEARDILDLPPIESPDMLNPVPEPVMTGGPNAQGS
jgi:phage portal protein BeeE